jgi:penicillin-insensitive murein endopeptidase
LYVILPLESSLRYAAVVHAVRALALVFMLLWQGCAADLPRMSDRISYGAPNRGYLHRGLALPDSGPGYVRARPGESTRFGTPALLAALQHAAAAVAQQFPGSPALRIGDLSAPLGGDHDRHGSHRSGRDADLMFYALDARGMPAPSLGMFVFDRFGIGREVRLAGGPEVGREAYLLDAERNWQLVRTLLLDDAARVQWIFCSHGVKAVLLRYAVQHEKDPDVLVRAAYVLHQPSSGRPHNDHFHVRVACAPEEAVLGCRDYGPIWPWQRNELDKAPEKAGETLDDDALVSFLLSPLP